MYERITLANGVRIIYEKIPHVRSVSMGIWVGVGSRHETAGESGASHFIEHMVFKGTAARTAAQLAAELDGIGGQVNAFTTKECTCFHGRVLDIHLDTLTDVLCDMFFNSRFDEADVRNELGVVLEEIDMYEDTPEDLVSERLFSAMLKGASLARPVLGRKASLRAMTGERLRDYMSRHYRAGRVVVALSGNVTRAHIARVRDRFAAVPAGAAGGFRAASCVPAVTVKRKSLEQNHICLGFPGLSIRDPRRYAMQLLTDILGGGMSSRLFQTVRERMGLCYTVYAYGSSYQDTGILGIYTAVGRETQTRAVAAILDEVKKLTDSGVTDEELARAREQVKVNILMGLESTSTRMNRLGRNELFFGEVPSPDEVIARYETVTADEVLALARDCLKPGGLSLSAVGRFDGRTVYETLLGRPAV